MIRITGRRTATSYTVDTRNGAVREFVWDTEQAARQTVNDMEAIYLSRVDYAPGLEVRTLELNSGRLWIVVFEDVEIAKIHKAIRREQPVTISYGYETGEDETVRTIEPYALVTTKAGNTLIKSMDRESGELRSWRWDRMKSFTIHRTRFLLSRPETKAQREERELREDIERASRIMDVHREAWTAYAARSVNPWPSQLPVPHEHEQGCEPLCFL